MALASVIIPTYNRAHLIGDAIKSVLHQTFSDFELIVVDDGSTDNTEEVVRSFSDERIIYIKQSNQGVSAARNVGIEISTGQYLAFLDSDDLFLPEKLEFQLAKVQNIPGAGLTYGRYFTKKGMDGSMKLSGSCNPQLGLGLLLLGPAFHWSTVLLRRSWAETVGSFDETLRVGEEWELTLRLAVAGCPMHCIFEPVSIVRTQPDSLTRNLFHYENTGTAILDKIFSDPRVPDKFLDLREIARASLLLRRAGAAYLAANYEQGKNFLIQAMTTVDPTLSLQNKDIDLLIGRFVAFLVGVSLNDAEDTLRQIAKQLPGTQSWKAKLGRNMWGKFFMEAAFRAYRDGRRQECRGYALRAITESPASIRNRGLVSILVQSFLSR